MRIGRVFPRVTEATPHDELCFYGSPPSLWLPEMDEVHISVTFTYDIPEAERLAEEWKYVGVPVHVDGPAYDNRGGDFVPGIDLAPGYVISSRGCNNHCWFCDASRREGPIREIPITQGWNLLDNNILQCSREHIQAVFNMLGNQPQKPEFTGGLYANVLEPWHVAEMKRIKTKRMYFAYDTPDDYEPLVYAGRILNEGGFHITNREAGAYVLIGYPGDTFEKAEVRLLDTIRAGFVPFAMLYRSKKWKESDENTPEYKAWRKFQKYWCRPAIVYMRNKELFHEVAAAQKGGVERLECKSHCKQIF